MSVWCVELKNAPNGRFRPPLEPVVTCTPTVAREGKKIKKNDEVFVRHENLLLRKLRSLQCALRNLLLSSLNPSHPSPSPSPPPPPSTIIHNAQAALWLSRRACDRCNPPAIVRYSSEPYTILTLTLMTIERKKMKMEK